MPIRNPFARRPAVLQDDENQRPGSAGAGTATTTTTTTDVAHLGFERVDTIGSKASLAFSIRSSSSSRRSQDTGEYKMSVVNDSGVYLPPSPVEREAMWPRRYLARTSSDRSRGTAGGLGSAGEMEHFPISRESFDSYRRSFDICAKSPVVTTAADSLVLSRQSLDSSLARPPAPRFLSQPRSSLGDERTGRWDAPPTLEETQREEGGGGRFTAHGGVQDPGDGRFEDVGLGDTDRVAAPGEEEQAAVHKEQTQQTRRRGFFAKFGGADGAGTGAGAATATPAGESGGAATPAAVPAASGTAMSRFLMPMGIGMGMGTGGRRAQSGGQQGAELGVMPVVEAGLDQPEKQDGGWAGKAYGVEV
ncbi:hypothetical protein C8A05DRAFT_17992 [Staphylotrichum tortipilum]|uniref:Uncharacterized protein n=1 Tax=Staphylotrichum tortipilum TaxID=2831512 RepID=A0AAN6MEU8_9PEZI|nr:hypothetical protein C8A05DRAFT_17992 [Staphylotrichum longicolle]